MTIEILRADMVAAMKSKDKPKKDAVSSLIAAVKKVAIDEGCRDDIPAELVDRVILKEIKTVTEQVDTCPDERAELKAEYKQRLEYISAYAPKLLCADEVREILTTKFADVISTKNKGMIMKTVMAELKGKADGKVINSIVAELTK